MKIDEALKLSDVAVTTCGLCVYRLGNTDWYYHDEKARSIYDLAGMYMSTTTWQPAYVRPQFQIGEKVSFLQACLSGQCFLRYSEDFIRKWGVVNRQGHEMVGIWDTDTKTWDTTLYQIDPATPVTIIADPSQEQPEPEKRQRTHAEIVADIKALVSELESARSEQ